MFSMFFQNGRIGADEEIDDTAGLTIAEVEELRQEREAKARATILEIVGDLPDADVAPPENVLFVCKLNPITTDEDLEIIFNRFGKVKRYTFSSVFYQDLSNCQIDCKILFKYCYLSFLLAFKNLT